MKQKIRNCRSRQVMLISLTLVFALLLSACLDVKTATPTSDSTGSSDQAQLGVVTPTAHESGPDSNSTVIDPSGSQYMDTAKNTFAAKPDGLQEQIIWAIDLADDLAYAQAYGLVNETIMQIGADAVLTCPHPLLLNNYASLLFSSGDTGLARYYLEVALVQQPGEPVMLTNLANMYLSEGDLSQARILATQALANEPDFGPAYQVLTTIHLAEGNSSLAAETLVKSARNCFNDLTISQFKGFLQAVTVLKPGEDEYPLQDDYIDILYDIAKAGVDTRDVSQGSDTPAQQIQFKPFPRVSSADNLMNSRKYITEEHDKLWDTLYQRRSEFDEVEENVDEYLRGDGGVAALQYDIKKNVRQIYAASLLQSFYEFKIAAVDYRTETRVAEIEMDMREAVDKAEEAAAAQIDEVEVQIQDATFKALAYLTSGEPEEAKPFLADAFKKMLTMADLIVAKAESSLDIAKRFQMDICLVVSESDREIKQLLEEYWLKMGGMLKYFTVESVSEQINKQRNQTVYEFLVRPISQLLAAAETLNTYEEKLQLAHGEAYVYAKAAVENLEALSKSAGPDVNEPPDLMEKRRSSQQGGESLEPDMEDEAISMYPDNTASSDISLEVDLLGLVKASSAYDGTDGFAIDIETIAGAVGGEQRVVNGKVEKTTYLVKGVNVDLNTGNVKDIAEIAGLLKTQGKLGQAAGTLGKFGIGGSGKVFEGRYITTDEQNRVLDRGIVRIREVGGQGFNMGTSSKVVFKKSAVTGVVTKTASEKYQVGWKFISIAKEG